MYRARCIAYHHCLLHPAPRAFILSQEKWAWKKNAWFYFIANEVPKKTIYWRNYRMGKTARYVPNCYTLTHAAWEWICRKKLRQKYNRKRKRMKSANKRCLKHAILIMIYGALVIISNIYVQRTGLHWTSALLWMAKDRQNLKIMYEMRTFLTMKHHIACLAFRFFPICSSFTNALIRYTNTVLPV